MWCVRWLQLLSCAGCAGVGDDEETKKQKQKQLIDAAFKLSEKNDSNGNVDGLEDSGDGGVSWVFSTELFRKGTGPVYI